MSRRVKNYGKWIVDDVGHWSKRYHATDPADDAVVCTCGDQNCPRGRLLPFRMHIAEVHRVLSRLHEEELAFLDPAPWASVLYALRMAASIDDVEADTGFAVDTMVFALCELTIDYENGQSEMASKYVAPEGLWSPDKLAVFLARKLATERSSPLRRRISVSPKRDAALQALANEGDWKVSTAVVVDGILRLFSSNPKRDSNAMRTPEAQPRSVLAAGPKDRSPLREAFLDGNDALIYAMVENYLQACNTIFWKGAPAGSYIRKTVGVQALFDILRKLAPFAYESRDLRTATFEEKLSPAGAIDFAAAQFQSPSGSGRSIIRRAIEQAIGIA